jgi:hypothetical protein
MSLSISKTIIREKEPQYPKIIRNLYKKDRKYWEKKQTVKDNHKDKDRAFKISQHI